MVRGLRSFWFFGLIAGFSGGSVCARLCAREGFGSYFLQVADFLHCHLA
jgi:hypothetical protein